MPEPEYYRLPMDERKRVTLNKLVNDANHISSFIAHREGKRIILEPMMEVPAEEAWVYLNPNALGSLNRGLSQEPKHDLGSFKDFADDNV